MPLTNPATDIVSSIDLARTGYSGPSARAFYSDSCQPLKPSPVFAPCRSPVPHRFAA